MSFVLPGNSRQLRFTGEARALAPGKSDPQTGTGALALGKPRVRKPPPPAPAARVQTPVPAPATARVQTPVPSPVTRVSTPAPGRRFATPMGGPDVYRHEAIPTPYIGSINPPVVRHRQDDYDDENPTMAMDRDGLDVLPGARAIRTPKPSPAPGAAAPIPHFRPAHAVAAAPKTVIVPGTTSSKVRSTTSAAPLAVWIFAGLLAGIISYHVAPELVMRVDHPARAAQQR